MSFAGAYTVSASSTSSGVLRRSTVIAAALAAAAGVVLVTTLRRRRPCTGADAKREEHELLIKALTELSRCFFNVCRDTADKSKAVRLKVKDSNLVIPEDKLREQLIKQCLVCEQLGEIQTRVAEKLELPGGPADIENMQRRAASNSEVSMHQEGFKMMLEDALAGRQPLLPGASIPDALTEEMVLKTQADAQNLEIKKVLDAVGGSKCTPQELGVALTAARSAAWEETLQDLSPLLNGGGPEIFYNALATYLRNSDFERDFKKLDDAFIKRMSKLFKPHAKAAAQSAEAVSASGA